jgi:hypothetical protein
MAQFQTDQQRSLGMQIGVGAAAAVAASMIYVATSSSSDRKQHQPAYRFIAPSAVPTRSTWSSWVNDW